MKFSKVIQELFSVFEKKEEELFLVGGAVRDMCLGLEPKDFDFATSAKPEKVMSMFEKVIPSGIDFGTVTVILDDEEFEITTYRKDHDSDGRRPKAVSFSDSIEEDLSRRDFTINAMALDKNYQLIDLFGGMKDLEKGIVRFVGDADKRVKEDKLRLMRGIRFASRYGFEIPEKEYKEVYMKTSEYDFSKISSERFTKELEKILLSKKARYGLEMLRQTKILEIFIPEFKEAYGFNQKSPYHHETVFSHILSVVEASDKKIEIRLAALFHDIAKPKTFSIDEEGIGHFFGHEKESAKMAGEIMKRLRFSKEKIEYVMFLIEHHMYKAFPESPSSIRRFIRKMKTKTRFLDLISLIEADEKVCLAPVFEDRYKYFISKVFTEWDKEPATELSHLAVDGKILMKELQLKPGKIIGELLEELRVFVIEHQEKNDKDILIRKAKSLIK